MNSYVTGMLARLGDADPLDVMAATPSRLEDLFWELGDKKLDLSYGEGKWTARQIFAHLADVEIVYGFRFRQALSEEHHRIQPMDQDAWARHEGEADASLAIELFRAVRLWNLAVLRSLGEEARRRVVTHPERGEETIGLMVKLLAGHDLNHLSQLEQIAARS
ncbi:MAG: DinB family protein [Acidobacteriota bacterium]